MQLPMSVWEKIKRRKPPWSSKDVKTPCTDIFGKLGVATVWEERSNTQVDFLLYEMQQPNRSKMLHRRFWRPFLLHGVKLGGKKPYHHCG